MLMAENKHALQNYMLIFACCDYHITVWVTDKEFIATYIEN